MRTKRGIATETRLEDRLAAGERIAWAAAGLILANLGRKRRGTVRVLAGAGAATGLLQAFSGRRIGVLLRLWLTDHKATVPVKVDESVLIYRSRQDVYTFWQELPNLAHAMRHVVDVEQIDVTFSKWTFHIPGVKAEFQWLAETTIDDTDERLAWRSVPGGDVETAGEVQFTDGPGGLGTVVQLRMAYWAPAGQAGRALSRVLKPAFAKMIREDLRRVKHRLETQEVSQ